MKLKFILVSVHPEDGRLELWGTRTGLPFDSWDSAERKKTRMNYRFASYGWLVVSLNSFPIEPSEHSCECVRNRLGPVKIRHSGLCHLGWANGEKIGNQH